MLTTKYCGLSNHFLGFWDIKVRSLFIENKGFLKSQLISGVNIVLCPIRRLKNGKQAYLRLLIIKLLKLCTLNYIKSHLLP